MVRYINSMCIILAMNITIDASIILRTALTGWVKFIYRAVTLYKTAAIWRVYLSFRRYSARSILCGFSEENISCKTL